MTRARRDTDVDAVLRAACVEMGCVMPSLSLVHDVDVDADHDMDAGGWGGAKHRTHVGLASRPLRVADLDRMLIANTVSLAWRIGRAVMLAKKQSGLGRIGQVVVNAVGGPNTARVLFSGKITDVRRRCVYFFRVFSTGDVHGRGRVYKGHTIGEVVIVGLPPESDTEEEKEEDTFTGTLVIPFKNENIYAQHTSTAGHTTVRPSSVFRSCSHTHTHTHTRPLLYSSSRCERQYQTSSPCWTRKAGPR